MCAGAGNSQAESIASQEKSTHYVSSKTQMDVHLEQLRTRGRTYLGEALAPTVKLTNRIDALRAAMEFLMDKKTLRKGSSHTMSQNSSIRSDFIGLTVEGNYFTSTMASLIDSEFPVEVLVEMGDVACKMKVLPLFVRTLQLISRKSTKFSLPSVDEEFANGEEFVDNLLLNMTLDKDAFSEQSSGIFIAKAATEVIDSPSTIDKLVQNIVLLFDVLDIGSLPSVVYQLLLMVSTKGNAKVKRTASAKIVRKIAELEVNARSHAPDVQDLDYDSISQRDTVTSQALDVGALRTVQGAILSHTVFLLKQDVSLGTEYLKVVKESLQPLSPPVLSAFGTALALNLMSVTFLRDKVFDTLMACLTIRKRNHEKRLQSEFIQKWSEREIDLNISLQQCAEFATRSGWESIASPLMSFCLGALDTVKGVNGSARGSDSVVSIPVHSRILQTLFSAHAFLREEIFIELVSRSTSSHACSSPASAVLQRICSSNFSLVSPIISKLKASLERLPSMSHHAAVGLIDILKPVFAVHHDIRKSTVQMLRKCLFQRTPSSRSVGAVGFVELVQTCKFEETEIEELIGLLRRVFTHQPTVRVEFYRAIAAMRDEECRAKFYPLLLSQADRYISESSKPRVQLSACFHESSHQLTEPLPQLLSCLAKCPDFDFDSITDSVTTKEMTDEYELCLETTDLNGSNSAAFYNRSMLRLLIGISQTLIGCYMNRDLKDSTVTNRILALAKEHEELSCVCQGSSISLEHELYKPADDTDKNEEEQSQTQASKKIRKPTSKFKFGTHGTPSNQSELRDSEKLLSGPYIGLNTCLNGLKLLYEESDNSLSWSRAEKKLIADVMVDNILRHKVLSKVEFMSKSSKSQLAKVISCFFKEFRLSSCENGGSKSATSALETVEWILECTGPDEFGEVCRSFRELNRSLKSSEDTELELESPAVVARETLEIAYKSCKTQIDDAAWMEAEMLLRCIKRYQENYERLNNVACIRGHSAKLAYSILSQSDVEVQSGVTKILVGLSTQTSCSRARSIASATYSALGDISGEPQSFPQSPLQNSVTRQSASDVVRALCESIEKYLDEMEWSNCALTSGSPRMSSLEKALCKRATEVMEAVGPLLRCRIPRWACGESLLRTCSRLYKVLSAMAKTQFTSGTRSEDSFGQVAFASAQFTPKLYPFLSYLSTFNQSGGTASRHKTKKETKIIPDLIFNIEQYETHLIRLYNKFKVNFLRNMKRSTARDFRIQERLQDEPQPTADGLADDPEARPGRPANKRKFQECE